MSGTDTSCCAPARGTAPLAVNERLSSKGELAEDLFDRVSIPGGISYSGTNTPEIREDEEGPLKRRKIKPFKIASTAVTNAQFAAFVEQTGYVTEAERWGWSFVFHLQVPPERASGQRVPGLEWWQKVDGANWRDVIGPGSEEVAFFTDHPVVHVSWNDAAACAAWYGGRLPSEAEWEHAARGGLGDARFPWGNQEPNDTDFQPCNIWQGRFPDRNTGKDGHLFTAPACSFDANGYGLFNICGNVWEWTSDTLRLKSLKRATRNRMTAQRGWKIAKGGSFLCHRSYCYRYRIAARIPNSPDSTTTHMGFRIAWDDAT